MSERTPSQIINTVVERKRKTAGCRLTKATDKNFEQIFDFGMDIFGLDQAVVM